MGNETRWTKGSWFVSHANDDQAYEIGIQSDHGMKWHVCDICEGCDIDRKANAHLIAAAPELYDALKVAHDNLYALINDPEIGSEVRKLYDLEDVANMAGPLAKARGEQS